jgi:o-succinylbenzoate---CoA ligase
MSPGPLAALERRPPAAPALAWPGGELSAGELLARVETLAGRIRSAAPRDGPIAIASARRIDTLLGLLAALRLGRPGMPLDPGRADAEQCLAQCAVSAVLRTGGDGSLQVEARGEAEAQPDATVPEASKQGQRPMLLVPTSGTAGVTRIAMLPRASLDAHVAASATRLPCLGKDDRWLVCLPITSIGALAALWRCLSAGACLGFLERFDADDARRFMAEGASHVSVVPAMVAPLAQAGGIDPRGLRCLLSGGGALTRAAAEESLARGWPLWNAWGMTETTSHVAARPVDADWREDDVGSPLKGVDIAIKPDGRVAISGPVVMAGYANPALQPGRGLRPDGSFLASDLGERTDDGRLLLRGRADDVIVSGGVNIDPQTVEHALAACEGVVDVAVLGWPDPRWGKRVVALYTGPAPPDAVERCARHRLPSTQRPREFIQVDRLPRNAMGKLMRAELGQLRLEAESRRIRQPE